MCLVSFLFVLYDGYRRGLTAEGAQWGAFFRVQDMAAGVTVLAFWLPVGGVEELYVRGLPAGGAEAFQVTDQDGRPIFCEVRGQVPDLIFDIAVEQFPDLIIGGIVR
jgi:hypothetical protein